MQKDVTVFMCAGTGIDIMNVTLDARVRNDLTHITSSFVWDEGVNVIDTPIFQTGYHFIQYKSNAYIGYEGFFRPIMGGTRNYICGSVSASWDLLNPPSTNQCGAWTANLEFDASTGNIIIGNITSCTPYQASDNISRLNVTMQLWI